MTHTTTRTALYRARQADACEDSATLGIRGGTAANGVSGGGPERSEGSEQALPASHTKRYRTAEKDRTAEQNLMANQANAASQTVVISAVNLRKGGTLAILRQYLQDYSHQIQKARKEGRTLRVIALVHDKSLCNYPGIEYMELPWCTRSWAHRLWAEYVTMHRISLNMAKENGSPVDLWLSLHDTTPNVVAKRQEVYCHTSFPFLKVIPRDWLMDPKIPIFSIMGKLYYRINVHRNAAITVQQQWFANGLSKMLGVPEEKFKVVPPAISRASAATTEEQQARPANSPYTFLYVATPDCHKNFETLLKAAATLQQQGEDFKVQITLSGTENRYARWLKRRWGQIRNVEWLGILPKEELEKTYAAADCFVCPSRVETWGLPISEYAACHPGGDMLLADLPYAHGTFEVSGGSCSAEYFSVRDALDLSRKMQAKIQAQKQADNNAARPEPSLKVLQLGKFYPIVGGVEKVMWMLTRGLGERGVHCDMLCAAQRGTQMPKDLPVTKEGKARIIRLNRNARCIVVPALTKKAATMISPAMITYLCRHAGEYDIIHVHHPDPMAALALWLSGYKGRVVLHWHSDILKQSTLLKFYMPLQNWLVRRAQKVIGTTPVYVKNSPHLAAVQDKCTFVPIGINKISVSQEKTLYLRELCAGRKLVFSLGRLVEYKGYRYLVEAAKYLPEDYVVVIAGTGPLKKDLEEQIARQQAQAQKEGRHSVEVKLIDYLEDEDKRAWMAAADVFVLPSVMRTEAFGIVQLEAMSVGTPLVATRIPGSGTWWVNAHGDSGINVEIKDPRALAKAVTDICSDPQTRAQYSERALKRFESMFTLEKMIDGVMEEYRKLNNK